MAEQVGLVTGGQAEVVAAKIRYVQSLPALFQPYTKELVSLPVALDTLKRLVSCVERDPNSVLRQQAGAMITESVLELERKVKKKPTVLVGAVLTAQQQLLMAANRAEFNLVFRNSRQMQHGVAATMRLLDRRWQMGYIPLGDSVLEVGAYPTHAIQEGLTNWKVSAPYIDYRDGPRGVAYTSYMRAVESGVAKLSPRSQEVYRIFRDRPDEFFLRSRAEDIVGLKVDWLFLQHSAYDISMENLAKMMHNTGAKGGYGSLVGTLDCLYQDSGRIAALQCHFTRRGERITFGFEGDSSFMYDHDFYQYSRYFRDQHLTYDYTDEEGRACRDVYAYRVMNLHAGAVYYGITRVSNTKVYRALPDREFYNRQRADWLRIKGVWVNSHKVMWSGKHAYDPLEYFVPKDTFSRIRERVRISPGITYAELISYARSQDVRFVVNGRTVKASHHIPQDVFEHAVLVAWALTQHEMKQLHANVAHATAAMHSLRAGKTMTYLPFFFGENIIWANVVNFFRSGYAGIHAFMAGKLYFNDLIPEILEGTDIEEVDIARVGALPPLHDEPHPQDVDAGDPVDLDFDPREQLETLRALVDVVDDDEREELEETIRELESALEGEDDETSSSSGDSVATFSTNVTIPDKTVLDDVSEHLEGEGVDCDEAGLATVGEYVAICLEQHKRKMEEAAYFHAVTSVELTPSRAKCEYVTQCPLPNAVTRMSSDGFQHQYYRVRKGVVVDVFRRDALQLGEVQFVYNHHQRAKAKVRRNGEDWLVEVPDGWYYTYTGFMVENAKELADAATRVAINPLEFRLPEEQVAVWGVPGCGKTWQIRQLAKKALARGDMNFMILVSASRSCEDTKLGILSDAVEHPEHHEELSRRVRTLDSFLMHLFDTRREALVVDSLWIDEALMAHAGQVFAAMAALRPRSVTMFGDDQQVPYVNFVEAAIPLRLGLEWRFSEVRWVYDTIRLSVTAAASVLHMYEGKIRVKAVEGHPIAEGTAEVVKVAALASVPRPVHADPKKHLCLTFSQQDKADMIKQGFCLTHPKRFDAEHSKICQVRTIVEAQGADTEFVTLYRSETRRVDGIYSQAKRVNVALTRAKRGTVYYTANDRDMATLWILSGKTVENFRRVRGEYDEIDDKGVTHYNKLLPYKTPNWALEATRLNRSFYFKPC